MHTRLYRPEDYAIIADWWPLHRQPAVPEAILPKCGVVVCTEGSDVPIAATWIYQDNSVGVAWLAWLVTDATTPVFHIERALEILLGGAETIATELDYRVLFTMTDRGSLGRWFEKNGFVRNHTGMSQFFKRLK